MAELQTSHDEVVKQLEASNKPSKEEQKKAFQEAFSNLRKIEVMHGEESEQYAGALTEYMGLKEKIIKEYNLILNQSESAISSMKDPNSFENKRYEQMSIEEAKKALENLNKKFKDLPTWTYTEVVNNAISNSFPNCENDVTSQRIAMTVQETLIKKIVGEKGYNSEVVVGFDKNRWNYIASISEVESFLKNENRTISSGSTEQQINSKLIANYLKFLSNSVGGDVLAFQNLFIRKFGEKKAKELVELWNNKSGTTAQKDLAATSFGSIIENISKIDINNIGENFLALGFLPESDVKKLGGQISPAGSDKLIKLLNNSDMKSYGASCSAARSVIGANIDTIRVSLTGETGIKNELADSIKELLAGIHISEEEKKAIVGEIVLGIDTLSGQLGSDNGAYKEIGTKFGQLIDQVIRKRPFLATLNILGNKVENFENLEKLLLSINLAKKQENLRKLNEELDRDENEIRGLIASLEKGEITQEQFDAQASTITEMHGLTAAQAAQAKMEAEVANREFTSNLIKVNGILTKKITEIPNQAMKDEIIKNPEIWLSLLDIKPLLEIIPSLPNTVTFTMMAPATRTSEDIIKILLAFKGGINESEIRELSSLVLFENSRKQGAVSLNLELFKTLFGKMAKSHRGKILIERVYELAQENSKISTMKTLKEKFNLTAYDFPLFVLKEDTKDTLFSVSEKEEPLKNGEDANIGLVVDKVLKEKQRPSMTGRDPISKINDYIELNGIEKNGTKGIGVEQAVELVKMYGIQRVSSIIRFLSKNDDLLKRCIIADFSTVRFVPSGLYKAHFDTFLQSYASYQNSEDSEPVKRDKMKSVLEKLEFGSYKNLIALYKETKDQSLFLESSVQGQVTLLIRNLQETPSNDKDALSLGDLKLLKTINENINSFATQLENVRKIHSSFFEKGKETEDKFLSKLEGVFKEFNISKADGDRIKFLLQNPDWFETGIKEIIKIFGGNKERYESFINRVVSIEIERDISKLSTLTEKSKVINRPTGITSKFYTENTESGEYKIDENKVREDFYAFLKTQEGEREKSEDPRAFEGRMLEKYLAQFAEHSELETIREILNIARNIEKKTYIRNHTPESIQAAVEGRFDSLYGSYLQSTYGLPASVVPGLENKAAPIEKPGVLPVVENGGESYLVSPTLGKIPLSAEDAKMVDGKPEAQKKLIRAYDMICNTLKLEKLWGYKDLIINAAGNVSTSLIDFNKNDDFWSEKSLKIFLILIGKSIGGFKDPISTLAGKPFDQIKQGLLSQNNAATIAGEVEDRSGRGKIEATFIATFDRNRDKSKTQALLETTFSESKLQS